jgi:hypothetical protein
MADVFFKLQPDLEASVRDEVLRRIENLPDVHTAGAVKGDASRASVRALCFARLLEGGDADRVAQTLKAMPEIQSADVPPRRGLATE